MKTIRNLNSSAVKGIAIIMTALLITGNLFAQKKNANISNTILKSSDHILTSVMIFSENYSFTEEDIELESWMTDLDTWAKKVDSASTEESDIYFDTEMVLEDWMLQTNWTDSTAEGGYDEEMELEEWMMSPFDLR